MMKRSRLGAGSRRTYKIVYCVLESCEREHTDQWDDGGDGSQGGDGRNELKQTYVQHANHRIRLYRTHVPKTTCWEINPFMRVAHNNVLTILLLTLSMLRLLLSKEHGGKDF